MKLDTEILSDERLWIKVFIGKLETVTAGEGGVGESVPARPSQSITVPPFNLNSSENHCDHTDVSLLSSGAKR
jgi:hypothetical protein